MERHVAIKKLGKLLGKNLGYRVDPKAGDKDDRAEAHAALTEAAAKRKAISDRVDARRAELLRGDAEFQRLKAEYAKIDKQCDALRWEANRYRFTVGISNEMFFVVKAQGDSWEEVIAKVQGR